MRKSSNLSSLNPNIQDLLLQAKEASRQAYAPYSHFFVGAALLTKDHRIYTGQNQENAAYPACMCAERVSFYHYCARSSEPIIALGVYAENRTQSQDSCAAPCGNCRQVILEYRHRQDQGFPIYSLNQHDHVAIWEDIDQLMPEGFYGRHLNGG